MGKQPYLDDAALQAAATQTAVAAAQEAGRSLCSRPSLPRRPANMCFRSCSLRK